MIVMLIITGVLFILLLVHCMYRKNYGKQSRNILTWRQKIDEWKSGKILEYPSYTVSRFFYETSVCDKNATTPYKEKFIESNSLKLISASDNTPFLLELSKHAESSVISFPNLSGDTMLIIPTPIKGKNYTTIKDFIDNAPIKQQKIFWKKTGREIEKWLESHDKVYVSTHGLGVHYFHLRLCDKPKYYTTSEFING